MFAAGLTGLGETTVSFPGSTAPQGFEKGPVPEGGERRSSPSGYTPPSAAQQTRSAADVFAPAKKDIENERAKLNVDWQNANKSEIKRAEEAAAKKREKSGGGGSVTVIMPGSGQFITGGMTLGPSSRMSSASQQTYAPQEAYTPVYEAPKAPVQTYVKYDPAKDFWSQYDALVRSMPYGATSSANAAQWQGQDPSAAVLGTDWGGGDAQPLQTTITVTPSNVTTYPYPMYPSYTDPDYGMSMTKVLNVGGSTTVIPEGPLQEFF
jgi:hypothetical protein